MRKQLYHWHVTLGRVAGVLLVIWATSGLITVVEPMISPLAETSLPQLQAPRVDPALFARGPAQAIPAGVAPASVAARSWKQRAWYEVTTTDGATQAYDAATGKTTEPFLTPDEVGEMLAAWLSGSAWTTRGIERLDNFDDHYRKGPLPVYRVRLEGPGGYVLYVDARTGHLEKKTTTTGRFLRWAGLGVHAWNLQAFRKSWDVWRRSALALCVALPLLVMAVVSVWLLRVRDQQARRPRLGEAPPCVASPDGRVSAEGSAK